MNVSSVRLRELAGGLLAVASLSVLCAWSGHAQQVTDGGTPKPSAALEAKDNHPAATPEVPVSPVEPLSPIRAYSSAEIAVLFERPATRLELLRNLKRALHLNLLLQPAFFEDSTLIKFFGGKSVTWKRRVGARGDGFRDAVVIFGSTPFPGMVVSLRKGELRQRAYSGPKGEVVPAHTAKSGEVTMSFDPRPDLTVESVRHEFGLAPIQVGVEAIASGRPLGPLGPSKSSVTPSSVVSNPESNVPMTDVYMRYASPRDLATRLASHVNKSEAIFGVGANNMIVGVSLLESEM
jgi:hypothetical protein